MKISELNAKYDKLQLQYGAKELTSIYNGGCTDNPDFCFVFMNPTGKNIASDPNWKGRRSPWIGTKNIWKLFYRIGKVSSIVLDKNISVSQCRKQNFLKNIAGMEYKVYPVYYPIGNGMMNIYKAIEELNFILTSKMLNKKSKFYYLLVIMIMI